MVITFGTLTAFFGLIVMVLYITQRRSTNATFSGYAVGDRSFDSMYVAMSYVNSWWPGATFVAFFGMGAALGVIGLYALVYTLIGVTAMYFLARRAWRWGSRFDLRTQPDMIGLRFGGRAPKILASLIGVVALYPWVVLGFQAMGAVVSWASLGRLSTGEAVVIGVMIIAVRQIWTVQMGMRGLIITDLFQGFVAYLGAAAICVGLLLFYFDGFGAIRELPSANLSLPGFDAPVGGLYYMSIVAAGVIGSLCWPMIFVRIYTAKGVRAVKKGTLWTMVISIVFYGSLLLVALAATKIPAVAAAPQDGWFLITRSAGGTWLLAAGILVVFAASMGFVDGMIQAIGTQVANDIIGGTRPLSDKQQIVIAKLAMAAFAVGGAVVAYFTYNYAHLVNFAQIAYQAIIQLAVPLFLGMFWRRGNKFGATAGLVVGFGAAVVLTIPYADQGGAVPWLAGLGSGLVALALNLIVYVACAYLIPSSEEEQARVDALFEMTRAGTDVEVSAPPLEPDPA
ncbi:solute:Na+ symporter, SSS family [Actinomadura madurae]|uniref:Solute:Na+ symporter, SSS family n=1 Tax=Actinomadura madurae TaxID=1993 RepID=A0A1I5KQ24_9ACTN|nr:sodium:solute symporter family protein [Actinomadura madurae]SFO87174.1 solute:Na+ symporter, SSS family [Actinomadura madurae]